MTKVGADNRRLRIPFQLERKIARTACNVKNDRVRVRKYIGELFAYQTAPPPIYIYGKYVIEEIVFAGDPGKHFPHCTPVGDLVCGSLVSHRLLCGRHGL